MTNQVVWITASAGTGKTTALINRYKSLLQTCKPEQIIGITFTVNAAEEIKERLVSKGAVILDKGCEGVLDRGPINFNNVGFSHSNLKNRNAHPINGTSVSGALDLAEDDLSSGILRIQTIHSLCHQLLSTHKGKNISILDPNEKTVLIDQALRMALNETTELTKRLAKQFSFYHLQNLMGKIAAHLPDRQHVIGDKPRDFDFTGVPAIFEPIKPNPKILEVFKDRELAVSLQLNYADVFLTKTGEVRKRILDASTAKQYPDLALIMKDEAHRVYTLRQERAVQEWLYDNNLMHQLAERVWEHYKNLKQDRLDYDELINATQTMLEDDVARYDICKSIYHVLLDEAQDTNPKQWRIIELLTQHLFDDPTANKSFFVVGDHKQSIYGFQNASPEFMQQQKQKYKNAVGEGFIEESLEVNYRSVTAVCDYIETQCLSPAVQVAREQAGFVLEVSDFDEALAKFLSNPPFLPSQNRPLALRDIMILCRKRDKTYHGIIEKYGKQVRFEQTQLLSDLSDIQKLMYSALLVAEPDNGYAQYQLSVILDKMRKAPEHTASHSDVRQDAGPYSLISGLSLLVEDNTSHFGVLDLINSTLSHNQGLLNTILAFVAQHSITTPKSLYWWLRAYPHSLKTVSTADPHTMRLLTMHGAKGLQAPVVFVFNDWTAHYQQDIWWNYETMDFVIPPTKSVHHPTLTAIRQQNLERQTAEDARLRYVAFTRAMDVLVIINEQQDPNADKPNA